jgi:hypothetical protein
MLWSAETIKCSLEMVSPYHNCFYGMEKPKWILYSGETIKCSSEMVSPHHNYFYGTEKPKWILYSGETIKCSSEMVSPHHNYFCSTEKPEWDFSPILHTSRSDIVMSKWYGEHAGHHANAWNLSLKKL